MKINKTQLRKVIRESIKNILKESDTLGYDQELQPGWYVCIEGNYGDVSVWVTDDLNEVMEVSDSSESNVMGPYNTEMEANEIANKEKENFYYDPYQSIWDFIDYMQEYMSYETILAGIIKRIEPDAAKRYLDDIWETYKIKRH